MYRAVPCSFRLFCPDSGWVFSEQLLLMLFDVAAAAAAAVAHSHSAPSDPFQPSLDLIQTETHKLGGITKVTV